MTFEISFIQFLSFALWEAMAKYCSNIKCKSTNSILVSSSECKFSGSLTRSQIQEEFNFVYHDIQQWYTELVQNHLSSNIQCFCYIFTKEALCVYYYYF